MSQRYRTIVADPPWRYDDGFIGLRGKCTSAEVAAGWRENVRWERTYVPFPTMTNQQIAALPIANLADRDCRLFLWATQRYMPAAYGLLEQWGFTYKQTLVWRKTTSFLPFSGSVTCNNVEFCLVAVRGKPPVVHRWPNGCIVDAQGFAGRRKAHGKGAVKHSQKPEAFMDLIESVSPGPYLEMFSRRARLGWDTWGNESLHGGEAVCADEVSCEFDDVGYDSGGGA